MSTITLLSAILSVSACLRDEEEHKKECLMDVMDGADPNYLVIEGEARISDLSK